ncbi:MAG: LysR family transcriptional regulator [Pseudomonadota bacterium]
MELKWLEDLVSVVEKGHFARAAEARNITQSAFSRRIKALEIWAGTELLDRSQHPVTLTSAGRNFISHAQDIIRLANEARNETMGFSRLAETGVTIACLHTLALFRVPAMVADLKGSIGKIEATIIAETRTVEEYLESLYSGASDFFICYRHPAFSFDIDPKQFPRLDIGSDRVLPYIRREDFTDDLLSKTGPTIPYLEYAGTSFMSRVVDHTVRQFPFRKRLKSVYRGTLAESLCTAAISGLGMAWLPESVVASNPRSNALRCVSVESPEHMQISVFSAAHNRRPIVQKILSHLRERGAV